MSKNKIPKRYDIADGVVQVVSAVRNAIDNSPSEETSGFSTNYLKGSFRTDDDYQNLLKRYNKLLKLCKIHGVFKKLRRIRKMQRKVRRAAKQFMDN